MPFLDLHAHFPMHTRFPPLPSGDPIDDARKKVEFDSANLLFNYEAGSPRVSLKRWFEDRGAGVTGFGSVLYDAEDDFFVGTDPIPRAFDHIAAHLRNVEDELVKDGRVAIARDASTVENCLDDGTKFIFHTLEGAFSLGGNPDYVSALADMGVASIIPAHLFFRGVATCENGFPPPADAIFAHEINSQPPIGLTDTGEKIVENMLKRGVLVDITHASKEAQDQIFEIASGYPGRPIISSHNSVRGVSDHSLNLSDDAIFTIQYTNGMIGVIFFKHWLQHANGDDNRDDYHLIFDVIDYIQAKTGSFNHIGIGSDLDGFIQPIEVASNYSKMSTIADAITARYAQNAELILWRNAVRVLHAGWDGNRFGHHS